VDLAFSEDQETLRASVRSVLERACPIRLVREVVERGAGADELWAQMVALDWPALAIGPEAGGVGLGVEELAVVAEELGRVLAPGPWLATATQFVPAVAETATSDQRVRFLGPVVRGGTGALALAEREGGFVLEGVGLEARAKGSGFVLEGEKRHVLDGDRADELVVVARLEEAARAVGTLEGLGAFLVPRAAARAESVRSLDATRRYAHVELDGVWVGRDRVLGEPGQAGPGLARAVDVATTALAFSIVGTCQAILDLALEHAKVRRQFGVPIGSFQAMQHKFADMYVALEKARSACHLACAAIAEDDARRRLYVSVAKAAAGDCERLVAEQGIQALGGIGFTWEHDMHLYVKRAKADGAMWGTAARHRDVVARELGLA
jgi:alkylation response protein AidB-like acyl-CoA dehydrogenase